MSHYHMLLSPSHDSQGAEWLVQLQNLGYTRSPKISRDGSGPHTPNSFGPGTSTSKAHRLSCPIAGDGNHWIRLVSTCSSSVLVFLLSLGIDHACAIYQVVRFTRTAHDMASSSSLLFPSLLFSVALPRICFPSAIITAGLPYLLNSITLV